MIKRFRKYNKFKEYISWEFENKFAVIVSGLILCLSIYVKAYESANNYLEPVNSISITFIGTLIGSLALIFSGIIFWGSLWDSQFETRLIRYTGDEDSLDRLYTSYLFLAFNILVLIVWLVIIIIVINSDMEIADSKIFYSVEFVTLYFVFFILAYFVAIIRNVVNLIQVQNQSKAGKSIYERANEIRIDMILTYLYSNESEEGMKADLGRYIRHFIELTDDSPERKKQLLQYFEEYYDLK